MKNKTSKLAFVIFVITMIVSYVAGVNVEQNIVVDRMLLQTEIETKGENIGKRYFMFKDKKTFFSPVAVSDSRFLNKKLTKADYSEDADKNIEYVVEKTVNGSAYTRLNLKRHFGIWSLLPAFIAVVLCWLIQEPISSLMAGIFSGALLLGKFDITEDVFLQTFMTKNAAGVLILYLWLLGGLMGIWAKTGAAKAFADFMTKKFVRGPRSAKLVAWSLGVVFFQGGTVSTVLVGTTVKPLADKEKISHEELAYIVDSTASPVASIIAFNAWPAYVQAFLFVPGVTFLATEADRVAFFFKSIPFSFYSILAVLGTFLLSIEKNPFIGKGLKEAMKRARETGKLNRDGSEPLSAKELENARVPANYTPHVIDFFGPLITLIVVAIGTFITFGTPWVRTAFGISFMFAFFLAMGRGMRLKDLLEGLGDGLKGVVMGSLILLLAITIGMLSKAAGGGNYLVELLGTSLPYWLLPTVLLLLTITIAFSTGTSWGTYAVTFPLAMPLAWSLAQSNSLANPEIYMMICFAAVMNGSVFGDQCSPISDTTVLSSMCTGCDLMDHVKTQLPPASLAAFVAAILWTISALVLA